MVLLPKQKNINSIHRFSTDIETTTYYLLCSHLYSTRGMEILNAVYMVDLIIQNSTERQISRIILYG